MNELEAYHVLEKSLLAELEQTKKRLFRIEEALKQNKENLGLLGLSESPEQVSLTYSKNAHAKRSSGVSKATKKKVYDSIPVSHPTFQRKELFDYVCGAATLDGNEKPMPSGTFGIAFSELVKSRHIALVSEGKGNQPNTYARGNADASALA